MEYSKSSSKREVYGDTSLSQKTRKIANKQPILIPKGSKKEEQMPQVSRRKEIIKSRNT